MGRIADMEWLCELCKEDTVAVEEIRGTDDDIIAVCQGHYDRYEDYLDDADTMILS